MIVLMLVCSNNPFQSISIHSNRIYSTNRVLLAIRGHREGYCIKSCIFVKYAFHSSAIRAVSLL